MKKSFLLISISLMPLFAAAQGTFDLKPQEIAAVKMDIDRIKSNLNQQKNPIEDYLKLGHLYSKINDAANAKFFFEQALSLDEKNEKAHFMLGLIYEKEKNTAKALFHWQKCEENTKNPQIKQVAQKHIKYLSGK